MNKLLYPAVFHPEGDALPEALYMAEDALGIYLFTLKEDKEPIPPASNPADLQVSGRDFVTLVEYDEAEYLKRTDPRAVKKTLTIPSWLNTMSERAGVNFSTVLQAALKDKLHISDR